MPISQLRTVLAAPLLLAALLPSSAMAGGRRTPQAKIPTILILRADLDGAAALPSNSEPATGDVLGTYDLATHVLKFQARFISLSGQATNARFHGPAAFDRTGGATVAAARPSARLVVGSAWLDDEAERDLLAGRWYFNVTTVKHPEGEIRGMVHVEPPLTPTDIPLISHPN